MPHTDNHEHHHEHKHDHKREPWDFKKVQDYVDRFDAPERDEWQKPELVFDALGLKDGSKLADFGAGTGYFTVRAAKRVGSGIVYAVDSEPEMLKYLTNRAEQAGLKNIVPCLIEPDALTLPEPVDAILIVNTYHHIDDRIEYLSKVKQWLRPGGKIAVLEGKAGSPIEPPAQFLMSADQVAHEFKQAGFEMLIDKDLPYQSMQVFARYKIDSFRPEHQTGVEQLVLPIQQIEFGVAVTLEGQPDLVDIKGTFQHGAGNFWVALVDGKVVGSVGIVDIANNQVALKKMFVHADYRGKELGVASALLNTVFDWCAQHSIRVIYLGTVDIQKAAHRFYEKNGFVEVAMSELPEQFPVVAVDTKFYRAFLPRSDN